MANVKTEYREAYCERTPRVKTGKPELFLCSANYDVQPVGGKMVAIKRAIAPDTQPPPTQTRQPAYDEDFVATVYNEAERGTHRIKPRWMDPRWSDAMRATNDSLYDPAQRDPPNRGNWYTYRSTMTDALTTPCKPLTVPDVHKLRYMSNNYMCADDWYD